MLGKPHARLSAVQRGCMMLLYAAGSGLGRVVEFLNTISCLLMVHWDRPTTSATFRHHRLQVPLLLKMVENKSYKQQSGYICSLLLG